jgi:NAD(P)-dependent dehydrogenase (short-subunit alcohol dehydrogenase family)
VTGGASAIGRAIALRFAQEGAAVVVADLREDPREGGDPTHEVITAGGGRAVFVRTDVTSAADRESAVEAAEELGGLDVLVNNAGVLLPATRFTDVTEADYDLTLGVNAKGTYFMTQVAVRAMVAAKRPGVVINLSSIGGLQGVPGISAYSTAKGAVRLMTYALAQELGPRGIRVCALHPGVIDSSMTRRDLPVDDDTGAYVPLRRMGQPNDVAGAAVFLASDLAGFVTGASLTVDGGQLSIG